MGKEITCLFSPIVLLVLTFWTVQLAAQPSSLKSKWFYHTQLSIYEDWLEEEGLSNVLEVLNVETKQGKLVVQLTFTYERIDSSMAAWDILREKFNRLNNFSLEKQLFFTACHIMKTPPHLIDLVIQNKVEDSRFYIDIRYNRGSKKLVVDRPVVGFRTSGMPIDVGNLRNKPLVLEMRGGRSKEGVYKAIFNMVEEIYGPRIERQNSVYGDEIAYLDYLPGNSEMLEFAVVGLRQEILTAEDNLWIGQMLNWIFGTRDYDWRKVENIRFNIKYKVLSKNRVQIECEIDARYGSGYYRTTDWQKCIPMSPEFSWYVQKYNDDFKRKIYDLFTR